MDRNKEVESIDLVEVERLEDMSGWRGKGETVEELAARRELALETMKHPGQSDLMRTLLTRLERLTSPSQGTSSLSLVDWIERVEMVAESLAEGHPEKQLHSLAQRLERLTGSANENAGSLEETVERIERAIERIGQGELCAEPCAINEMQLHSLAQRLERLTGSANENAGSLEETVDRIERAIERIGQGELCVEPSPTNEIQLHSLAQRLERLTGSDHENAGSLEETVDRIELVIERISQGESCVEPSKANEPMQSFPTNEYENTIISSNHISTTPTLTEATPPTSPNDKPVSIEEPIITPLPTSTNAMPSSVVKPIIAPRPTSTTHKPSSVVKPIIAPRPTCVIHKPSSEVKPIIAPRPTSATHKPSSVAKPIVAPHPTATHKPSSENKPIIAPLPTSTNGRPSSVAKPIITIHPTSDIHKPSSEDKPIIAPRLSCSNEEISDTPPPKPKRKPRPNPAEPIRNKQNETGKPEQPMTNNDNMQEKVIGKPEQPIINKDNVQEKVIRKPEQPMTNKDNMQETVIGKPEQPVTNNNNVQEKVIRKPEQPMTNKDNVQEKVEKVVAEASSPADLSSRVPNKKNSLISDDIRIVAYEDVRDDNTSTTWALYGYEGNNIVLVKTGMGLDGFIAELKSDGRNYGFVRCNKVSRGYSKGGELKFALITWIGEDVSPLKRGRMSTDQGKMKEICKIYSIDIRESTIEDLLRTFQLQGLSML